MLRSPLARYSGIQHSLGRVTYLSLNYCARVEFNVRLTVSMKKKLLIEGSLWRWSAIQRLSRLSASGAITPGAVCGTTPDLTIQEFLPMPGNSPSPHLFWRERFSPSRSAINPGRIIEGKARKSHKFSPTRSPSDKERLNFTRAGTVPAFVACSCGEDDADWMLYAWKNAPRTVGSVPIRRTIDHPDRFALVSEVLSILWKAVPLRKPAAVMKQTIPEASPAGRPVVSVKVSAKHLAERLAQRQKKM